VRISVYDVSGRLVKELVPGENRSAGIHTASWDGRNASGRRVVAGIYFYRLETDRGTMTQRMVLLR
jgi:flagellar hook assembly protein FlgD